MLACPRCGGRLRLIATVEDPDAIRAILAAASRDLVGRGLSGFRPPRLPRSVRRRLRAAPSLWARAPFRSSFAVGEFVRSAVAGPLGADFHIGLPITEHARAAEVRLAARPIGAEPSPLERMLQEPGSMAARAFLNPPRPLDTVNSPAWRSAEIPAANGHTTARAVARVYGALACGGSLDGVELLRSRAIDAAIVEQSRGDDLVLGAPTRFALGFMLPLREHFEAFGYGPDAFGPSARAFGHWGYGGSVGFADLDRGVGFAYVMNQQRLAAPGNPDRRWPALVDAAYQRRHEG